MSRRRPRKKDLPLAVEGENCLSLSKNDIERLKHELDPQIRVWLLRMLVRLGGLDRFLETSWQSEAVISFLLGHEGPLDFSDKDARNRLFQILKRLDQETGEEATALPSLNCPLRKNLRQLGRLVDLSTTDLLILEFLVVFKSTPILVEAADALGDLSTQKFQQALMIILDLVKAEARASLSPQGVLEQSGLLRIDRASNFRMELKFELLSDNFADYLLTAELDPVLMLHDSVVPSRAPTLQLEDFAHLGKILTVVREHLRLALANRRKGCNIFFHGPPGTGKTELARVLGTVIGYEMFEVAGEDNGGDLFNATERLRALRAAQNIFAKKPVLILFDEAEDVFNDGGFFKPSTAATHKAWLNRMLEENKVPTLWLSNSTALDPAFVRRFDIVLEIPVPPRRRREQMVQEICGDLLPPDAGARIATAEALAPAVLRRAVTVLDSVREELADIDRAATLETLINNTLIVQGHRPLPKSNAGLLSADYDLRFLRTDTDLAKLFQGLCFSRSGRFCLYGPPGTGKTAFGQWLARMLDAPLHVHRVSDIVSHWLGVTEKNLAKAFQEAEQDRAVLLVDEVDSFLRDRRGAQRSWEITEVNEMLAQMENFSGIFIASTNLLGGLDQAALRRFDLKIRFSYLTIAQSWPLLLSNCQSLGLSSPPENLKPALAAIKLLTPGDFAAVNRRHQFQPITSPAALLAALEAECAMKEGARSNTFGFV